MPSFGRGPARASQTHVTRVLLCTTIALGLALGEPWGRDALAAPPTKVAAPAPSSTGTGTVNSSGAAEIESAEQLYAKLDYEQANTVADRVTKRSGLSHDQLVRAYRVLGITYAILDKEEQAKDAFLTLLTYDPEFQIDTGLGPKVTTPYMEARGTFRSLLQKPGIDVVSNVSTSGGTVKVTTRNPTKVVKKVVVGYRWTSSGSYTVSEVAPGEAVIEVSAAPQGRTRLDFYAQALDERDNAVFEAGNATVPKSAFAAADGSGGGDTKKDGTPFYKSPIFWAIAGAAAIGGGTAIFFAARPNDPPTSASLTGVMFCGGSRCN